MEKSFNLIRSARFIVPVVATLAAQSALAVQSFTPSTFSALTGPGAASLIQTVAIGADYHDYMPATPLGVTLGVDLGIEVTAINVPTDFINTMALVTGQTTGQIPTLIPVPKLSFHKGLPFGIDLGFTWISLPDSSNPGTNLATAYGGDIKWAFIRGGVASPSVAVRLSGAYNQIAFLQTHSYDVTLLASKNFYVIDPYIGTGMQFWSGDLNIPVGVPGLPATVSAHQSGMNPDVFVGMALKLLILKITAEYDYSFAGFSTFGGKLSLGF